jgi:hypothetical protein
MPKDAYEFDSSRAYAAREAAREAARKQESEEPVPDPPPPRRSYGRIVVRTVARDKLPSISDSKTERRYKNFCPTCEGVMVGSGYAIQIQNPQGKQLDELYQHLPRELMRKNAATGCSLCRLLIAELRQRMPDSEIGNEAENFVGYDFGSFLGDVEGPSKEKTLVVLFYEYAEKGRNNVVLNLQNLAGM